MRLEVPPAPLVVAAALVAAISAIIAAIATGRSIRWLSDQPRLAAIAAALGGLSAAGIDLAIIALLAIQLIANLGKLSPAPVTAAAIASLLRIALARRGARKCLAARAALS